MKKNFFKTKKVTVLFAIASLIAGFLFINKSITGNIILDNYHPISAVSIIGLTLIFCSIILGIYTLKK